MRELGPTRFSGYYLLLQVCGGAGGMTCALGTDGSRFFFFSSSPCAGSLRYCIFFGALVKKKCTYK